MEVDSAAEAAKLVAINLMTTMKGTYVGVSNILRPSPRIYKKIYMKNIPKMLRLHRDNNSKIFHVSQSYTLFFFVTAKIDVSVVANTFV